jgi:hypothetical protein
MPIGMKLKDKLVGQQLVCQCLLVFEFQLRSSAHEKQKFSYGARKKLEQKRNYCKNYLIIT